MNALVIAGLVGLLYLASKKSKSTSSSSAGGSTGPVVGPDWNTPDPAPTPDPDPAPDPYDPKPDPTPTPDPYPQPQPNALLDKINSKLAQLGNSPYIVKPASLEWQDRKIMLAANGYSYGIDIYVDAKLDAPNYVGWVVVVSSTKEAVPQIWRATSIPALRDKLVYLAQVLKAEV